jgi:hypothetical protein
MQKRGQLHQALRKSAAILDMVIKAFREKPESQIFAKRNAPLNRCTRSAVS